MSDTRPPLDIARVIDEADAGTLRWLNEDPVEYDAADKGLRAAVDELLRLLAERSVDYVLVGGLAVLHYIPGRNTYDIDVIMAERDLARLPELDVFIKGPDFVRAHFGKVVVDALLPKNPLFRRIRDQYSTTETFAHGPVRCATPAGLLLMKLYALPSLYRLGRTDRLAVYHGDVYNLLATFDIDTEPLLGELSKEMLATDITELRKIIGETREAIRLGRENRFGPGPAREYP